MAFAFSYFTNPDDFPVPGQGVRWGKESLKIEFLGGPYLFTGLNPVQLLYIKDRFDGLVNNDLDGFSVNVQVYNLPDSNFVHIDTHGWEYHMDFDYQEDCVRIAGHRFVAQVQLQPELQAWLWTCDDRHLVSNTIFENLFRIVVAYRLLQNQGVLLHSAGLMEHDQARLFIGHSGAGKSTLSRLCEQSGMTILSDDMNAVVKEQGRYCTEQLPFAGEHGQTAQTCGRFPVRSIHVLHQAGQHSIEALSRGSMLSKLIACAPFLNMDPFRAEQLTYNLLEISKAVECGTLHFRNDSGVAALLQSAKPARV